MAVGKETEKGAGDEGRRSALALYEDIEAEHMAALEATGIAFAPYDSERLEREGLLRQLREGETIGTTAFQSYTQFGQRHIGAFIFRSLCIQITQDFHSFFIFITYLLSNHEFDTVSIIFT